MNPLYQMMQQNSTQQFQNPLQTILQAMNNPAAFVKQRFPDIPDNIANDPNQILAYLQQTRGIPNEQINNLLNSYGGGPR